MVIFAPWHQPGIRKATVNRPGVYGSTVSRTVPSQGYWVSCVSVTVLLPTGIFAVPATYRFT